MKPCAYSNHPLLDHLKGTAELADRMVRHEDTVISRRLEPSGLKPGRLKHLINLAALTHDIGKGADEYQRQFSDMCSPIGMGRPSFAYHELPSAMIAWRLCERLGLGVQETSLIFLAVLQHVNAMRDWLGHGELRLSVKRKFGSGWNFSLYEDVLKDFLKQELGAQAELDVNLKEALDRVELINELLRRRDMPWLKLYCLVLAPIMAGDNLDAYEARNDIDSGSRRWFMEELKAVLDGEDEGT